MNHRPWPLYALPALLLVLLGLQASETEFGQLWLVFDAGQLRRLHANPTDVLALAVLVLAPFPACRAWLLWLDRRWGPLDRADRLGAHLLGFGSVLGLIAASILAIPEGGLSALLVVAAIVLLAGWTTLAAWQRTIPGREGAAPLSTARTAAGYAAVVASLGLFGALAVCFGQDYSVDFINYHYYNGFTFLNPRDDLAVADFTGAFNPLLDVGVYLLSERVAPAWVGFALGAWHGASFVLVLIVALKALGTLPGLERQGGALALACAVAGVAEPMFLTQLGTSFHDNLLTVFILAAVYVLMLRLTADRPTAWMDGAAGALVGVAVGLKLTAASFAVGLPLALAWAVPTWRGKARAVVRFGIGATAGALVVNGFWMVHLYETYQNPVFPFFNSVFKSPYWPDTDYHYLKARTFSDHVLYPLYFAQIGDTATELPTRDFRLPLVYLLLLTMSGLSLARFVPRWRPWFEGLAARFPGGQSRLGGFLIAFGVGSYVAWHWQFCIMRYLVAVKVLAPLLGTLLVFALLGVRRRAVLGSGAVVIACVVGIIVPNYGRRPWGPTFLDLNLPRLGANETDDAAVLMIHLTSDGGGMSIAAAATGFPREVRCVNLTGLLSMLPGRTREEIDAYLFGHEGPLYLLGPRLANPATIDWIFEYYGLDWKRQATEPEPPRQGMMGPLPMSLWRLARRPSRPVPADFDGDGRADLAIVRHDHEWQILESSDGDLRIFTLGDALPVPADYNGDGRAIAAVFQPEDAQWRFLDREPIVFGQGRQFGGEPVPVPADYDGDGIADLAVFQPETAEWTILRSREGAIARTFGQGRADGGEPVPVPADYDGDGIADLAVFQPETAEWLIDCSHIGLVHRQHGHGRAEGGDPVPVPADYDGDGIADLAVFQPETAEWMILRSQDGPLTIRLGRGRRNGGNPVPVPADYDGDGMIDLAVFDATEGRWTIFESARSQVSELQPFRAPRPLGPDARPSVVAGAKGSEVGSSDQTTRSR